jgi:hypothetical protein
VKRTVLLILLILLPIVTTVSTGSGSNAAAGATTSRPSQFCTAVTPAVQASQRLNPILAGMSSLTVATTKAQLLTEMNTILNTFRSIKVGLRSAPANVRRSFTWDVLTGVKVQVALGHATTTRHIRAAVGELVGTHAKEAPFITYIQSRCEGPAFAGTPATM